MNSTIRLKLAHVVRNLTSSLTYSKRLPRELGGGKVRVSPRSDLRFLYPGLSKMGSDLFQVAELYVSKDQCVWDLGANLGIFSFAAAWRIGSGGKVFAIEADPFYADQIHKTQSGLPAGYGKVTPLCAAVADRIGLLELCVPVRGHSRNHLAEVAGNSPGETASVKQVCAVTGDFLVKSWPKPDLVKIDIEGAEHLFFRGASELLKSVRPIFYVEVSEENTDEITSILLSNDYELFQIGENGEEKPLERCQFNTLAKPKTRAAIS